MHIYFMGICGTAMGNAALLLRQAGHQVSGSDSGIYPPMSHALEHAGIAILEGYDAQRLQALRPDLVVVGNAQTRGNEEVEWLLESRALPFCSLPALLGDQILEGRTNIVISGTHGKTTTTAITAHLLRQAGLQPGWLVGGVPKDLPAGAELGASSAPFVIEGDEYDSAFFDKRSKFIHYRPSVLVINNIEFDHADIFRDLAEIQRSFNHLLRIVPRNGWVIVNGDDENIEPLLGISWTRIVTVGCGESCDLRIHDYHEDRQGTSFTLVWRNTDEVKVHWQLSGLYNARNAAAAVLASRLSLGHTQDPLKGFDLLPLSQFQGVKRRQELRYDSEPLTVIEDFGHHPTALEQALEAMRKRYPEHFIIAAFEPRSNTAVTNIFQFEFTRALSQADAVVIGHVHRSERIPEHLRLDAPAIAEELSTQGKPAIAARSNEEALATLERLRDASTKPALVCFFSNGSFGGIIDAFTRSSAKPDR